MGRGASGVHLPRSATITTPTAEPPAPATSAATDVESVMAGEGFYSAHSQSQHVAAAVAFPYLAAAAESVPLPGAGAAVTIGDFGCAGGANEMAPMALAIDTLRKRTSAPVEIVHTDLPQNDFGSLFALLASPSGYPAGRQEIYPSAIGRTLYGPLLPERQLLIGWSGITLHWLSTVPVAVPDQIYPNLVTGPARERLRQQSADDWNLFLTERARELVDGGELVLVAGASQPDGRSGAEALMQLIGDVLQAMVDDGVLRDGERERMFYPTWNRTPEEWLAPFDGPFADTFEVIDQRFDAADDSVAYPQFRDGGDAEAFAQKYVGFVRAITEVPFFRWLDAERDDAARHAVTEDFYARLEPALRANPTAAAVWHTMSLRIRRRPARGAP